MAISNFAADICTLFFMKPFVLLSKTVVFISCVLAGMLAFPCRAQLTVTTGQTAATLATTLSGPGVTVINPVLTCPAVANGTFTYAGSILAISDGILLTNGHAASAAGPEPSLISFNDGAPGDPALAPFLPSGTSTYDACILEFDVVPTGDTLSFNYQFGSEEYRTAVCSQFTDIFAFFISGPGITGTQNIALVPGTTIPVEINTVNNGIPGTVSGATIGNCTSLGLGSPFTAYYLDNTGGTTLAYRGYTTKFKALHAVTACDTYHLKLSIADAGNAIYDSGVFLEAGSLTSNSYKFSGFDSIGHNINGIEHAIVRGCTPATVNVIASFPNSTSQTISLSFGGTAVNGTDITLLPNTVTFPAGSTSVGINIQALVTAAGGPKTFVLYLHSTCGIFDSVAINIIDSPSALILTPDTTICVGQSCQIRTQGTPGLTYSWAPASSLNSATVAEPIATPPATTIYSMTTALPGSGCVAQQQTIKVTTTTFNAVAFPGDSVFCVGTYYTFNVGGNGANYVWAFGPSDTVKGVNPVVHAWAIPGTYTMYLESALTGCGAPLSKVITVYPYPDINLGPDTSVCPGGGVVTLYDHSNVGVGGVTWLWNTGSVTPAIQVTEPGLYYATATENGCIASDSIWVANDCYIDLPNVFTPNGDGINDYFFPRQLLTRGLTKFSMNIYNRWGQLIFKTDALDGTGWDGMFNDAPQPQGVYVYVIDAQFKDGEKFHKQGNVTLLK